MTTSLPLNIFFECRTSHTTGGFGGVKGNQFTCLIVHKKLPTILYANQYPDGENSLQLEGDDKLYDVSDFALGWGDDQKTAWQIATLNWENRNLEVGDIGKFLPVE